MRVHDSQTYRRMDVTRESISRILELRETLLSIQTRFSLVNAAVVCAILESISGLVPSSVISEPRYLKLVTVSSLCPFTLIFVLIPATQPIPGRLVEGGTSYFFPCRSKKDLPTAHACLPFIRSGQNHIARHSERGKKTRQTEKEVGKQHRGMDRPGVRKVPEGSGEQGKMEKTGCKIICGAPTTLAVKKLMMMIMGFGQDTCTISQCQKR